jgi:hypothetical protein
LIRPFVPQTLDLWETAELRRAALAGDIERLMKLVAERDAKIKELQQQVGVVHMMKGPNHMVTEHGPE